MGGGASSRRQLSPYQEAAATLKRLGFKAATGDFDAFKPAKHNGALRQCAVHAVARHGDVNAIRWIAENGGDLRARDSYNQSPLLLACESGNVEVAQFLFSQGGAAADITAASDG